MLTKLKKRFQVWIASEARIAHELGLTPNRVSAIGIAFAILSAITYWLWQFSTLLLVLAPLLLLASGFCDALDGTLARQYGETTMFGGFLDSVLDRYADSIIFCGIILGGLCPLSWGLAALTGSLLVSYARARAEIVKVEMETVGIAERAERLVILAATSFLSIAWREALIWGIVLLAIITNITVVQRIAHVYLISQRKKGL